MEYIQDLYIIGKYVVTFVGIIGIILLFTGIIRKERMFITRAVYLIILSIVLGVCGYMIYQTTLDRVNNYFHEVVY